MKLNFLKKVFRELKKIQRSKLPGRRKQIYKYFYTQCMGFTFRVKHKFSKEKYNSQNIFELKWRHRKGSLKKYLAYLKFELKNYKKLK